MCYHPRSHQNHHTVSESVEEKTKTKPPSGLLAVGGKFSVMWMACSSSTTTVVLRRPKESQSSTLEEEELVEAAAVNRRPINRTAPSETLKSVTSLLDPPVPPQNVETVRRHARKDLLRKEAEGTVGEAEVEEKVVWSWAARELEEIDDGAARPVRGGKEGTIFTTLFYLLIIM